MNRSGMVSVFLIGATLIVVNQARVRPLVAAPQSKSPTTIQSSPTAFSSSDLKFAVRRVVIAAMKDDNFRSIRVLNASSLGEFTVSLPGFESCYVSPDPQKENSSDETVMYVCARFFEKQTGSDKFYDTVAASLDEAVGNGKFRPTADEDVWKGTSVESSLSAILVGSLHHKCYGIDDTHLVIQLTESHDLIKLNEKDPNDYSVVIYIHQKHAALSNCK